MYQAKLSFYSALSCSFIILFISYQRIFCIINLKRMSYSNDVTKPQNYRYELARTINSSINKSILVIMIFPSSANESTDDNTVRKVCAFAKNWKFGQLYICNLYAFRAWNSSNLRKLIKEKKDLRQDRNINTVKRCIKIADTVVYAWGFGFKQPKWLRQCVEACQKIPQCLQDKNDNNPQSAKIPLHPLRKSPHLKYVQFVRNPRNSD